MRIESSELQYPLPVVGFDWDNTFNNTRRQDVYSEYSDVWYPVFSQKIHKEENLIRYLGGQTGYLPGKGSFSINGVAVGSTSDVYSDHSYLGRIIIRELEKRYPNDQYLPFDVQKTDELLNQVFRKCKPQVEIPFRSDAYPVLSRLLNHHLKGDFFFFIYTSSQPESIHGALPRLDTELAKEFAEKGEIFKCIKHKIAGGNRFSRTPDGISIPKTVFYPEFKSETPLRRPLLYKGLMKAEAKAHGLKEGEVVDLRKTNTILVDDGCELGLALPDYLGATTVLFGTYGSTEFLSEVVAWNGKSHMNPKRYAVDSLSAALLVVYQCTGMNVDVNNIDMLHIVLNALENDYTLDYNLHTPLIAFIRDIFEKSNGILFNGMSLRTLYPFKTINGEITGRNSFSADEVYMHDDNRDGYGTFGLYSDLAFIEQWKKNEVEDM